MLSLPWDEVTADGVGSQEWVRLGGKFTMSDDSHGIAQVATNYVRGIDYLESLGVKEVWTFEREPPEGDGQKARLIERSVSLAEFRGSLKHLDQGAS